MPKLDGKRIVARSVVIQPTNYLRCTEYRYAATPLGMGYGETRFASPTKSFKLLYIAINLATAIVETIVRDRLELNKPRELAASDIGKWGATAVTAGRGLRVLDLRDDGCFKLGVSTDISGAKGHDEARQLSQQVYDDTALEGIVYDSRLIRKTCLAIYDRSVSTLSPTPVVPLSSLVGLPTALAELEITLV